MDRSRNVGIPSGVDAVIGSPIRYVVHVAGFTWQGKYDSFLRRTDCLHVVEPVFAHVAYHLLGRSRAAEGIQWKVHQVFDRDPSYDTAAGEAYVFFVSRPRFGLGVVSGQRSNRRGENLCWIPAENAYASRNLIQRTL